MTMSCKNDARTILEQCSVANINLNNVSSYLSTLPHHAVFLCSIRDHAAVRFLIGIQSLLHIKIQNKFLLENAFDDHIIR